MMTMGGFGQTGVHRCLADKARRMQRNVSRIDQRAAERMFPESQRQQWPKGYLPASGVAHLLQPDGVPFEDLLECHHDIRQQGPRSEVQSDFASDYTMWTRFTLDDFTRRLGDREKRRFKKVTARDRAVHDHEIRELFHLAPYAPPPPSSSPSSLWPASGSTTPPPPPAANATATRPAAPKAGEFYQFTPYASTQQYAMLPVHGVQSPTQRVRLSTFPQLRNVVHTDFDSMGPIRGLSLYSGDDVLWSAEAVQALAFYLKERLAHYEAAEAAFLASAPHTTPSSSPSSSSSSSSSSASLLAMGEVPTFSRDSPILCLFGNGRLPFLLQATHIVPALVRPVQLPAQEARRARQYKQLLHQQNADTLYHPAFRTIFPCETLSVGDALRKYRPAIVLVEPHVDRDWLCDVRGFFSVREVLAMGPVDGPAMGSFAYPFLSFGVSPGPSTYWTFNDNLQRVHASERIQMPVDPPHEAQGYRKENVDALSAWLISANDCPAVQNQARAVRFVREVCPVIKSPPSPPSSPEAKATA